LQPARLALLKAVAAEARQMHLAVYIVGGFVRDLLLDRPSLDFDLVVEGDAIALARALEKRYGGRVLAHARFGTSKWSIAPVREQLASALSDTLVLNPAELPASLDLISARQEFYDYPTALPTVERSSIKLDLHRRDFTINTIALRLDGNHYGDLYDYWGGLRDLQASLVRVLHSLSFVDDPTRQLRAVRFEQRFNFQIDERTLELMNESRPLIRNLSGDRLRHEINLILEEEKAIAMLERLNELGLLSAIHPDLPWSDEIARAITSALKEPFDPAWDLPNRVANLPTRIALAYLMWLERLPVEKAFRIAEGLKLPGSLQTQIVMAVQLQRDLPALTNAAPSQATRQLERTPILALYSVYCLENTDEYKTTIQKYVTTWRHIQPTYTGEDLRLLGISPGPVYKKILDELRAAWLDGLIKDHTDEQQLFNKLIAEHQGLSEDKDG
jgi:tRNA nucleotidyltransferase (CCA-adding enzyme)